jgi:antitoxin VapB
MLTRIFKSGNSQAVRIPKDLQFNSQVQDVVIERHGDSLIIRPARGINMAAIGEAFAAFPDGFMAEGREPHEETERDWQASAH